MKPLDKAVYWIEYVIRHNGAHHLKLAGDQLNWFQFMSIDVILLLLILLLFIFISFYIMEKMYKTYIESNKSNTETQDDDDQKNKKDN